MARKRRSRHALRPVLHRHRDPVTTNPDTPWLNAGSAVPRILTKSFFAAGAISSSIGIQSTLMPSAVSSCATASKSIRLPPRSPNLNAFAERFVRSMKEECLGRMIFFGQASLRYAVKHFLAHYHAERNHRGLGKRLVQPNPATPCFMVRAAAPAPRRDAQLLCREAA